MTTPAFPGLRQDRLLLTALLGIAVALTVVSLTVKTSSESLPGAVVYAFDLGQERNVPSWFSTGQLLAAALLAAGIAVLAGFANASIWARRGWWVAAGVLAAMSLDELISLHEQLGRLARPMLDATVGQAFDGKVGLVTRTGWVSPGVLVGLALAALFALWWRQIAPAVRVRLGLGLALLLAGAVGAEIVGSIVYGNALATTVVSHIEELLEMAGVAVILDGLRVAVRWQRDGDAVRASYAGPEPAASFDSGTQ